MNKASKNGLKQITLHVDEEAYKVLGEYIDQYNMNKHPRDKRMSASSLMRDLFYDYYEDTILKVMNESVEPK